MKFNLPKIDKSLNKVTLLASIKKPKQKRNPDIQAIIASINLLCKSSIMINQGRNLLAARKLIFNAEKIMRDAGMRGVLKVREN